MFLKKATISCGGKLLNLSNPVVMGIVNVTPDSFYGRSRSLSVDDARASVFSMVEAGATIIDVGAYSSRPGAKKVGLNEELERLNPVFKILRKDFPDTIFSVDTFRAEVAARMVEEFGVNIVNDISGGELDDRMFETVARLHVPYVLMHMRNFNGGKVLEPEKATNLEVELGCRLFQSAWLTVNAYRVFFDKAIVYTSDPATGVGLYANVGKQGAYGFETDLRYSIKFVDIRINYSSYTAFNNSVQYFYVEQDNDAYPGFANRRVNGIVAINLSKSIALTPSISYYGPCLFHFATPVNIIEDKDSILG